jgi:hypothetical protein
MSEQTLRTMAAIYPHWREACILGADALALLREIPEWTDAGDCPYHCGGVHQPPFSGEPHWPHCPMFKRAAILARAQGTP